MAEGTVFRAARTSPPVRVSYPQIFTPKTFQAGQTPRFSIVLMIDKTNKEQMDFMKGLYKDATEVLNEKWPDPNTRPRIPLTGHDSSLFKDGDIACNKQGIPLKEKNPEYAGHYIIRAGTTTKPVVVNRSRAPISDANEVYGGCWCNVNINTYSFNQQQNKGVTIGLNGVQKWKDDESFGSGRPAVDEMFDAGTENDPANYGDNPFSGMGDPFAGAGVQQKDTPF